MRFRGKEWFGMRRKPRRAQAQVFGIMVVVDVVACVRFASRRKRTQGNEVLRFERSSAAGLVIRSRVSALEGDSGSRGDNCRLRLWR